MAKINFQVIRHFDQGLAVGGHVLTDKLAFSCPMICAAIELRVGDETVWLTRDETLEVAQMLLGAAHDA